MFTQIVSAFGVGVTPGNLDFTAQIGGSDTESLFVINTGTEVSNYKVYVDKDYADWFDISPDNFTLSANENKEVILTLKPQTSAAGDFNFMAYVVVSSTSSDVSIGHGIKIPVHAKVSNSGIMLTILLIIIVGAGVGYIIRKK
ncbi:MAG: hypothetical protein HF976_03910 [ANME-2 cluster archaeon]|nr:hypothetical protein [ANME-2 cluster archaeon]MBC2700551.1 hypothetical protein [ANME-2 cluster archaeon]MBC2706749.1 hypothetical protein [ANME-2 cluster archaeon]MBC2748056.1 hypothetical protein [ANME-2 cluster archaeon]